jgi:hypothetical protein
VTECGVKWHTSAPEIDGEWDGWPCILPAGHRGWHETKNVSGIGRPITWADSLAHAIAEVDLLP